MGQLRFVERRLPLTKQQIEKNVAGATFVVNVDIHLDPTFTGFVTIVCDGMMAKAVTSQMASMAGFQGTSYTFNVAPAAERGDPSDPVSVTIYANSEIHVKEVNLRE